MRLVSPRPIGLRPIAWISLFVVFVMLASSTAIFVLDPRGSAAARVPAPLSEMRATVGNAPSKVPTTRPLEGIPTVQSTLVDFNDSLVSGNFQANWSTEPIAAAGDPTDDYLFIADQYPAQISVVSVVVSVGVEVVATIPVPGVPEGVAYDPVDGSIYVTNSVADTVMGINATNLSVDTTIPVGTSPSGILYDSHDQDLYVANTGSNNVTVINGTTNLTIGPGIPVGVSGAGNPTALAFDSGTDQIFVPDSTWGGHSSMPVEVINDSNNSVVATVYVGDEPVSLAYDPTNSLVYVVNELSNNLTAISDATDTVVGNFSGFDEPEGATYLPAQQEIDVADTGNDSVSSFWPGDNQIEYNTTVGDSPIGIAYVPLYGTAYPVVMNWASANVSVLDDGTNYVDYNIRLAQSPLGSVYDSFDHEVWTTNNLYVGTVNVINDSIDRFPSAPIWVGHYPVGLAYDPAYDYLFVANSGSNTVSVISGFNNTMFKTIPVGNTPEGITYDPGDYEIWVANSGSDNVSVIDANTTTLVGTVSLPADSSPEGLTYDSQTGFVYVTEQGYDQVALINASSQTYVGWLGAGEQGGAAVFDSVDHLVYVANENSNNVTVYDQTNSTNAHSVANISVPNQPSGLAYDPTTDQVFVSEFGGSQVAVIQPSNESVVGTVNVGSSPGGMSVDIPHSTLYVNNYVQGTTSIAPIPLGNSTPTQTFLETGLPSGATWYVNISGQPSLSSPINGGAGAAITTSLAIGTYNYTAATDWSSYATTSGGEFTVGSSNSPIPVYFTPVTFPVYANETGLPVGATWYFNVTGHSPMATTIFASGVSSVMIDLQNGSYDWSAATDSANYSTTTPSGSVQVHGAWKAVTVSFEATVAPLRYLVTFNESALPAGVTWYVNITGQTPFMTEVETGGTTLNSISLENGTFNYSVATNSPAWTWNDSTTGSSFQVSGAPQTITLEFNHLVPIPQYTVTFTETGLPTGDRFTVLIATQNLTEAAPSDLVIHLVNGSYAFTVDNEPQYNANRTSGTVVVHGQDVSVAITFTESTAPTSPNNSTSAFSWTYVIIGGVVLLAILLLLFFLLAGRRRRKKEPENADSTGAGSTGPESGST
jgi:YVTN family beta-propeller protein